MKSLILEHAPARVQDLAIGLFNTRQYRRRHGGSYRQWRNYFASWDGATREALEAEQARRLARFLDHVTAQSAWYRRWRGCDLAEFPFLEKRNVLTSLSTIATVTEAEGVPCYTGGTTGASMRVLFTPEDTQERHACLDHFRSTHGYQLGKKVAWFSGKQIVRPSDLESGRVFRDDHFNNIRFFSTFHINRRTFDHYWNALEAFAPEFLVGFPSSVCDICALAKERGLRASWVPRVFFPTAETVLPGHRALAEEILGCAVRDQYASSEGAPFIFECAAGRLHLQLLSGVFEVLDEDGQPAQEGELVVTSFTTRGTPLVRYRIGDRIRMAAQDAVCTCGSQQPLVQSLEGRPTDFVLSPENGRVNLGNLSNCTKGVAGILRFQVIQQEPAEVDVLVEHGAAFDSAEEAHFLDALRLRLGNGMAIRLQRVEEIPKEPSGKFRIVKNHLPQ
ncbi:phenylacetate--CoA ligase family protein [Pseudoxanthomonas suwonensis]|uniref:phenylacetate--CoA ligase family protein n=1 Tax=Pseudoxanthomonas suwonensis TaxID=314722 RepID=UPI000465E3E0|nr:phenylacetate--CoA ligase family protein [Pseudoxanthomonas suwonensis]